MDAAPLPRLIAALRDPARYPHPADTIEVIETHISVVVLAGAFAYKLKKPVDFGFLDFRTLAARRHFCEEEVRINRRTAPQLYLDVVALRGTPDAPRFDGADEIIEFAVRMRRFPDDALLVHRVGCGGMDGAMAATLGAEIASFHAEVARADATSAFGDPDHMLASAVQNFSQMLAFPIDPPTRVRLSWLQDWTGREFDRLRGVMEARTRDGFVRECHGDLHLGNIAWIDGAPVLFDAIEFNADFRWIDVMSDLAFVLMDLLDHDLAPLAARCLDAYLEATGDFGGVALLRFHVVYRAMVRAKIATLRAHQSGMSPQDRARLGHECTGYLDLARRVADGKRPALVLMHGLSGTGKSVLAGALMERIGAIRVRSDVERKRLHGLEATARSGSAIGAGLYTANASEATYEHLLAVTRSVLEAGWPVIIDAAFLRRADRARFLALAESLAVPRAIVACRAPVATLRARILRRAALGTDPSEAGVEVLGRQIATAEPLTEAELRWAVEVDTTKEDPTGDLARVAEAVIPVSPGT
jgi:aminoglycoside phosphotransferase family enzyme/predicted kinase